MPFSDELIFLKQQTGQDESTILIQALHLGLSTLYCQTVEQLFIDDELSREKAIDLLGQERVLEIEYTKEALRQEICQGLQL